MKKILQHPVSRAILSLLACLIAFILVQNVASKLLEAVGTGKALRNFIKGALASIAVILTYRAFFKWIEKRQVTELSTKNVFKNILIGLSVGVNIQLLTIGVIWLNHGLKVIEVNPFSFVIIPLTVAFSVAILEEILIRGIIFRIIEEKLGSYIALAISAIIFGALHLFNPNATLISASCVAVEAGLLLGAAYIYSRSLWLPIAIHFAWNFVQSGIFSAMTSGNDQTQGLLKTEISGSTWITGGPFGPEGTIQATLFCLAAAGTFMYFNIKQGKLIKRTAWRNKR